MIKFYLFLKVRLNCFNGQIITFVMGFYNEFTTIYIFATFTSESARWIKRLPLSSNENPGSFKVYSQENETNQNSSKRVRIVEQPNSLKTEIVST